MSVIYVTVVIFGFLKGQERFDVMIISTNLPVPVQRGVPRFQITVLYTLTTAISVNDLDQLSIMYQVNQYNSLVY